MTQICRFLQLSILATLCVHVTAQQITCEELSLDSTIQHVTFTEQHGIPFAYAGYNVQPGVMWYLMNINGHDITQAFLSEVPTKKGHAQWIPKFDGLESKGLLNGDCIINYRRGFRIYTFDNGFLMKIVAKENNSIEIYYFDMIVHCGVPIIIHSNQWRLQNIFPTPIRNSTFPYGQGMVIFNCQGTARLFPTLCGEDLRAKLCKQEGIR